MYDNEQTLTEQKRLAENALFLEKHRFAREKLKDIFTRIAGELPNHPESIFQNDHWAIKAPELLDEICAEFNLYES